MARASAKAANANDTLGASKSNRVRRWAVAATLVVLLSSGGLIAIAAGALDVERVHFSGLHRVSYDEAFRAAAIRPGDFMGTLDTDRARRDLGELPWVYEARIRRDFPATVDIEIVERTPVALALSAADSWSLVDGEGRVLTAALRTPPGLPRLSGIAAAPAPGGYLAEDAEALLEVLDAASSQTGFAVTALWRDGRGDLRARVQRPDDGAVFETVLGDDSAIGAKTAAIAAVVSGLTPADGTLDVSVAHLPIVRAEDR